MKEYKQKIAFYKIVLDPYNFQVDYFVGASC